MMCTEVHHNRYRDGSLCELASWAVEYREEQGDDPDVSHRLKSHSPSSSQSLGKTNTYGERHKWPRYAVSDMVCQ